MVVSSISLQKNDVNGERRDGKDANSLRVSWWSIRCQRLGEQMTSQDNSSSGGWNTTSLYQIVGPSVLASDIGFHGRLHRLLNSIGFEFVCDDLPR